MARGILWVYAPFVSLAGDVSLPGIRFTPDSDVRLVRTRYGNSLLVDDRSTFTARGVGLSGDTGFGSAGANAGTVICVVSDVGGFNFAGAFVSGNAAYFGVDSSYRLMMYGSSSVLLTGVTAMPNTGPVIAGMNFRGSGRKAVYLNGKLDAEGTDPGYSMSIDRIGGASGSGMLIFKTQLMVRWLRELCDAEHMEFARNPWQVLK